MSSTIKEVYRLSTPKNKTGYLVKDLGLVPEKLVWPTILCGVEIEVERCPYDYVQNLINEAISVTEDHSLRNQGLEIITAPINSSVMIPTIKYILDRLPVGHEFSPRTSIHFHFNMLKWSVDKVKCLLFLYVLFENSLFRLVKPNRKESIFCVPVCDTDIYYNNNRDDLQYIVDYWHKYTAFNLKPLISQGTVEFRHLHGTNNLEEIKQWFYSVLALISFAEKQKDSETLLKTICDLNTNSQYEMFGVQVFGEQFQVVYNPFLYSKDLEHCIKAIKAFKRKTKAFDLFFKGDLLTLKEKMGISSRTSRGVLDDLPIPPGFFNQFIVNGNQA